MRVLIAEDELVLCGQIKEALTGEGHAVDVAHDGEEAEFLGETEPFDVVILDLGLPMRDGLSVLKSWRSKGVNTPVLILTARDGWSDRVDGLDAGADDYLTKPFHMPEVCARVRALIRRNTGNASPVIEIGGVTFDSRTSRVLRDGMPVTLTGQEVAVLSYLFHNTNQLISRTELSEHIYRLDEDRDSNTIAVFVTRLRKKLGNDLISTVRGRGYMVNSAI